mgnify:CR=1 FL=1
MKYLKLLCLLLVASAISLRWQNHQKTNINTVFTLQEFLHHFQILWFTLLIYST